MELFKEAVYLLTKWGPKSCPDWIEGVGDCGKCPECRVFKCIDNLELSSQPEDSAVPKIVGYCCGRCFRVYELWKDSAKCCEGC